MHRLYYHGQLLILVVMVVEAAVEPDSQNVQMVVLNILIVQVYALTMQIVPVVV